MFTSGKFASISCCFTISPFFCYLFLVLYNMILVCILFSYYFSIYFILFSISPLFFVFICLFVSSFVLTNIYLPSFYLFHSIHLLPFCHHHHFAFISPSFSLSPSPTASSILDRVGTRGRARNEGVHRRRT